jgi:imidazolonepropionase
LTAKSSTAGAGTLWLNAKVATLSPDSSGLGVLDDAAMLERDGKIAWIGSRDQLPERPSEADIVDLEGRWITPALVDCHTHIVHGGNRAREFEMRLAGSTYEEIAKAGGGIISSVQATNSLSVDELVHTALPRLDTLLLEGVSTVEVKSGYGLNIDAEIKMLRAARALAEQRPVRIQTSWLAAHSCPFEYRGRNRDYVEEVVLPGLVKAHAEGLVDAVDGFCERIAFSVEEIRVVFEKAKELGLPVKLHAEQLSDMGGAKLAASYGALSADHLEYLDEDGARQMAEAGTVAVLLPGAFYAIREKQVPPIAALRAAGTRIAIATDCNPGTSPLTSVLLTMNMAATLFGLTVDECIAGATREGARALGLLNETGTLEVGKSADFAVWDIESLAELVYRIGFNPLHSRVFKGKRIA